MTDEQIEQLAYKHSCCDDEPLFEFGRRDLFAFARALLSASIADTARAKALQEFESAVEKLVLARTHKAGSEIVAERKALVEKLRSNLFAAPPAPSVDASAGVIAAAESVIRADRDQALTTDHISALENAIAIQRGEVILPDAVSKRSVADAQVDDLRMLVQRLVHALNKASPSNDLGAKALDYLQRNGIGPSPLRESSVADAAGAFDIALQALDDYQANWDTGLPGEYAQSERIHMECAVEAVREALNEAKESGND